MHPFGLYLAVTDRQREHGWVAVDERRPRFAGVDAAPLANPEAETRVERLAAIVRRRIMRTANA